MRLIFSSFVVIVLLCGCVEERLTPTYQVFTNSTIVVTSDTVICNYEIGYEETVLVNGLHNNPDSLTWRGYESSTSVQNLDSLNYNDLPFPTSFISLTVYFDGDSSVAQVTVNQCFQTIYIPMGLTPNGDGLNDSWYPIYDNISEMHWIIRSDEGQIIFQSLGDLNATWDGTWNSNPAPPGLYQYQVWYSTIHPVEENELNGWLQLYRN